MDIVIKRIYDAPDAGDGTRVLVDRLWPRGMKKVDAHLDLWDKDGALRGRTSSVLSDINNYPHRVV